MNANTSDRLVFRFSVASMLIGTTVLTFVLYATMQPSTWTASASFTVAIVILFLALVRGFSRQGQRRRNLLAFGLSGFAYLLVMYAPYLDERVGARLLPTVGFAALEHYLVEDATTNKRLLFQRESAVEWLSNDFNPRLHIRSKDPNYILPQETWAGRAFHSAMALLCACVGGWVAGAGYRPAVDDAKNILPS